MRAAPQDPQMMPLDLPYGRALRREVEVAQIGKQCLLLSAVTVVTQARGK